MALLRKNRIISPPSSPNRDNATTNLLPSVTSTALRPNLNGTSNRFYPKLILSQILALQSLHYMILSILIQINCFLFGTDVTIDHIFTAKYLSLWTPEGRVDAASIIISSLFGSLLLAVIVEKSKKCLDFAVTLFLVHFMICSIYEGTAVFHSVDFWIVHVSGMIIMILFGEYFCSKRELMDIPML